MKKLFSLLMLLTIGLLTIQAQPNASVKHLSAADFKKAIDTKKYIIIDVRSPAEYAQGHIAGALNINVADDNFVQLIKKATVKSKAIALYCRSGRRSKAALSELGGLKLEFIELNNGVSDWQSAGYKLTKE
jgi:rhodanese-related sulfurtransferase